MKNSVLLSILLVFFLSSFTYAQQSMQLNSDAEIEAFKRSVLESKFDVDEKSSGFPAYSPEATAELELQLFVELSGTAGESAIETDGEYIYVGRWNNVMIDKYDLSGSLISSFSIPNIGHFRDFAWDGEYLYATDGSSLVYEIDVTSESLNSTIITSNLLRGIAYNEDNDVFYGCNLSHPIVEFDRSGNTVAQYDLGVNSGLYGLAYDNTSPDGPFLWGFSQFGATFVQYNAPDIVETGITFSVNDDLGLPDAVAGGLAITTDLFPGTVSLLGLLQSEAIIAYEAGQTVVADNDVAVQSILSPVSGLNLTSTEPVTIKVRNYGTQPQSDIPVSFTLDGGETFTGTVAGTLEPGASIDYTFNQSVDLSTPDQTYTISACTNLDGDEFTDNDCKTRQVTHELPFYCIPQSNCNFGDGFVSFSLGEINNPNSGCSPGGYGDFTNLSTVLQAGETYTITWSSGYNSNYASLWIDLDQDIEFDENERLITGFELLNAGVPYETQITIPEDALDGETTLRIRAEWLHEPLDPCETSSYGEIEDYSVFISNTPLPKNVGVKSIDLPAILEAGEITPAATVKNYGTETQSFPVELTIGDYASTAQVTDLAPGDELFVEFESWLAEAGSYTASACTQLEGDEFTQNDCKDVNFTVIASISAYGYVNFDNTQQFDDGWVAFDLTDPGSLLPIENTGILPSVTGATYVGDKVYFTDNNDGIYEFDPVEGEVSLLWNVDEYYGIAFDGSDFYVNTTTALYKFDMSSGEAALVGEFNLNYGFASIAFDGNGELWGVDMSTHELYRINKATAEPTLIGSLNQQLVYLTDISFDKQSNTLYMAGSEYLYTISNLYVIDLETGQANAIAPIQNGVWMSGLAVTSSANFAFPPRNLAASTNENNVNLSWDDPFGGSPDSYNIYRDDALIGTTTETEFVDAGLEIGFYAYTVTAVYIDGESDPAGPVEVAIGNPELTFDPESIEAVIEMGEATTREITIHNEGNLDLDFNLTVFLNPQTSSNPAPQQLTVEEFNKKAIERFGENWQELANPGEIVYSPEGIDDYCIPSGNCNFEDGLTNFTLGEISNLNSGCSPDGYGDFTNLSTSLDIGMPYEITASSGYHNNYLTVWIDLNQNEIFEEEEKLVEGLFLEMAGELYTTQITIPEGALLGETRLRAVGTWINPAFDPCGFISFGEAEDYTVNIGGVGQWISVEPESGTIAPGDSTIITVTLDAADLDPIEYMGAVEIATNDSSNLVANIPVNLTVIEQGISNFFPVWETPFNPMTIFVVGSTLDSLDLDLGDEIGVFDIDPNSGEEICVGAGLVINPITPENILEIIVSADDGSNPDEANGFTTGNEMIFRMWNSLTGEVDDITVTFPNPGFDEVFTPLGTAIVALEGSALVSQPMNLSQGWNLVSSRAKPHNTNMMTIFQPLIDMGVLEKIINEDGGSVVYIPYPEPEGRWNNSIGDMEMSEGYYVKVSEDLETSMYGLPVELPMELPLESGWNIMGYPAESAQDALETVDPLIAENNLYKVIDEAGGVIQYLPFPEPNGTWINTIGDFNNGQGYYIKVYDETSLMIEETPGMKAASNFKSSSAIAEYFEPVYQNNPYMPMHFILYADGNLEAGDEIGIFDGDVCVGASVYDGNAEDMTITVTSMDDPDTEIQDGYTSGNEFEVRIWKAGMVYENVEMETLSGPETFTALESYIGNITETITSVGDLNANSTTINIYPNPAKDNLNINLNIEQASNTSINLYRLDGTLVKEVYSGNLSAGQSTISESLAGISPGVYFLKTNLSGDSENIRIEKVVIK